MTVEEIRRKYHTIKAREEGKAEGLEKGKEELIKKQFSKGLSIEYIAEINDLDIEYVKNVVEK